MSANPTPRPYDCAKCGQVHSRCLAHRRLTGQPCGQQPVDGHDVCKDHGARSPQAIAKASERVSMEAARNACERLGIMVEVDPGDALIRAVWESAGNVEFYRQLVAELPTHPEADILTVDANGDPIWEHGDSGVYGRTYHLSGVPTGEAKPHVLVVLYNEERDRLVTYTRAALAAGVEERRVRMAEADARTMFAAVGKALDAANLTAEQVEVIRSVLAQSLREPALDAGRPPGPTGEPVPA